MWTNYKYYIIAGVGIVILIALIVLLVLNINKQDQPAGGNQNNSNQISIVKDVSGQPVPTKDFLADKPRYGSIVPIYSYPGYAIQYDDGTKSFLISFQVSNTEEFAGVRREAEQRLLSELGIDEAAACKLKVLENVQDNNSDVDDSVTTYLSFCPGNSSAPNK
jgi:hypothetical protein